MISDKVMKEYLKSIGVGEVRRDAGPEYRPEADVEIFGPQRNVRHNLRILDEKLKAMEAECVRRHWDIAMRS